MLGDCQSDVAAPKVDTRDAAIGRVEAQHIGTATDIRTSKAKLLDQVLALRISNDTGDGRCTQPRKAYQVRPGTWTVATQPRQHLPRVQLLQQTGTGWKRIDLTTRFIRCRSA